MKIKDSQQFFNEFPNTKANPKRVVANGSNKLKKLELNIGEVLVKIHSES